MAELRQDIRVYAAYVDYPYCYALTCISLVPEVLGSDKPCYGSREEDLSIGSISATYTKEATYIEPTKVAVRYINSRRDTYLLDEGDTISEELLGLAVNQLAGTMICGAAIAPSRPVIPFTLPAIDAGR